MILTPIPLDNPWKRGAIGFLMFNMLSSLMIWIVFDINEVSQKFPEILFFSIPIISAILFFLGIIFPVINRTKFFVLILGLFGILPILFSCVLPFFLYIFISNFSLRVYFFTLGIYTGVAGFWVFLSVKKTAEVERKFNYLKSQIIEKDNKKIINREKLLEFSNLERSPSTKKINLMKSIIIPLSFVVYPLQKLLSSIGGDAAVLGFVSTLSIPLSIYFMGKIASGYYLWVYSISKLEKEYNSKITM